MSENTNIKCENCKRLKAELEIADWYGQKFCRVNCFASVANQLVEMQITNPELKWIGGFFVKDVEEHIKHYNSMDNFSKFHSLQRHLDKLLLCQE